MDGCWGQAAAVAEEAELVARAAKGRCGVAAAQTGSQGAGTRVGSAATGHVTDQCQQNEVSAERGGEIQARAATKKLIILLIMFSNNTFLKRRLKPENVYIKGVFLSINSFCNWRLEKEDKMCSFVVFKGTIRQMLFKKVSYTHKHLAPVQITKLDKSSCLFLEKKNTCT